MPFLNGTVNVLSVSNKTSVWAQILCVLRRWDVSVGVGLEGGSEIVLIIRVVHAILWLVFLNAVDRAIRVEWVGGLERDFVQILGSSCLVFKAVQVL